MTNRAHKSFTARFSIHSLPIITTKRKDRVAHALKIHSFSFPSLWIVVPLAFKRPICLLDITTQMLVLFNLHSSQALRGLSSCCLIGLSSNNDQREEQLRGSMIATNRILSQRRSRIIHRGCRSACSTNCVSFLPACAR